LEGRAGCTLLVSGDVPLITGTTLAALVERFHREQPAALVLTARTDQPGEYGRVFCEEDGRVRTIIEAADASQPELAENRVNAGIYCFNTTLLLSALGMTIAGARDELCNIVDVIGAMIEQGHKIYAHQTDFDEIVGVNNRMQLQQAAEILNRRICRGHMERGVTIFKPESVRIDHMVELGQDVIIHPNCILTGNTVVGRNTCLGPDMDIHSSQIGSDGVFIRSWIRDSVIGDDCRVGPNCQLTGQSILQHRVHMASGAVAEHVIFGSGCRIGANTFLNNIQIGEGSYVGAGTVNSVSTAAHMATLANTDPGLRAVEQKLGNNVMVGMNVTLSGKLEVGSCATISDGALIRQDIPEFALVSLREKPSVSVTRGRRLKEKSGK
jgi:bifunctional UDP-N-acetylglucosamine pyrophosphorylase/glucosamine-1-phosphate N-acetyltransferase